MSSLKSFIVNLLSLNPRMVLLGLSATTALHPLSFAKETCVVKGDVFFTSTGSQIHLNFAPHFDPNLVAAMKTAIALHDRALIRELVPLINLQHGQHIVDSTKKFTDLAKSKKLRWIGGENSPTEIKVFSDHITQMSRAMEFHKAFLGAGLKGDDARKLTALVMGPSEFLALSLSSDIKAPLIPLESEKTKGDDRLATDELAPMLNSNWQLPEGEHARQAAYDGVIKNIATAMHEDDVPALMALSGPIESFPAETGRQRLRDIFAKARAAIATFDRRNTLMAERALQQKGDGVISAGSDHRPGVIRHLTEMCKSVGAKAGGAIVGSRGAGESRR